MSEFRGGRALDPESVEGLRVRVAELEADVQEFIYVASHDLTEPLRMVTSYLGLLERRYDDQLDAPAKEFIGYAVDGAERMRALLDDLLGYARVRGEPSSRAPVDVGEILDGVLRSLEPAFQDTGATVTVTGTLPMLTTDAVQLGQLLQNLIANAAKFRSPERPNHVTVQAARDAEDAGWLISVADDGIGIDPRNRGRIFEVFQRLHTREEFTGTGIGLAVCRRVVQRLGWAIEVQSTPGTGSTFTVVIPDERAGPA